MKKILSYILILCFIFTLITNVFADVQGTWNSDCSDYVKNGIRDNSGFLSTFNDKFIWAIRTPKGYAHVSNSYNMGLSGAALALDKKINIWGYKVGDPQSNYTKTEIESGGVKFSGSSNKHVTELLNISDDFFTIVKTKQTKAFGSDSLASRFDINLAGISSELSDLNMQSIPKETVIDSTNKRINFTVERQF